MPSPRKPLPGFGRGPGNATMSNAELVAYLAALLPSQPFLAADGDTALLATLVFEDDAPISLHLSVESAEAEEFADIVLSRKQCQRLAVYLSHHFPCSPTSESSK